METRSYLSDSGNREASALYSLQMHLLDITDSNISEVVEFCVSSIFVENENQEKDILQTNGDDIRMNRASKRTWGTQKIVGTALVVGGIICGLLSFVLNRDIFPILGVYLFVCGVSCLTIKKHIVLVLSWITILPLYYFSRRIAYAMWVLLLILVVLLALTIRCFVKEKSSRNP